MSFPLDHTQNYNHMGWLCVSCCPCAIFTIEISDIRSNYAREQLWDRVLLAFLEAFPHSNVEVTTGGPQLRDKGPLSS